MKKMKLIILLAFALIVPGALAHEDCQETCRDNSAEEPPKATDDSDVPPGWKARFDEVKAMRNSVEDSQITTSAMCRVRVVVKVVFWPDPHIYDSNPANNQPDRFILIGPQKGVSGDYIVIPIITGLSYVHRWTQGPKTAVPFTGLTDTYLLNNVVVSPHYSPDTHLYKMEIKDWARDDCPEKVEFKHLSHGNGGGDLHPGHAGAERG